MPAIFDLKNRQTMIYKNLDGSDISFGQDGRLSFNEEQHLYTLDGTEMRSVSNVVGMFFREFDAVGVSLKKCYGNEVEAAKLREVWESKGAVASQAGTFLHKQIEDGIKELIVSGILTAEEQLPSVRELSVSLTVNPKTVQRAYKELETEGFIYSIKGRGNFVSPVASSPDPRHTDELYATLTSVVKELMYLGEDKSTVENVIINIFAEKEDAQ